MHEEKYRLRYGILFGFILSTVEAFAILIPAFYLSSLSISIAVYAFLLSIGDVVTFVLKPFLGRLTDKFGEKKFLVIIPIIMSAAFFLIGFTTSSTLIVLLSIVGNMSASLLFVLVIIYGLRMINKKPDAKVGMFGGLKSSGWIIGLLLPGLIVDRFGLSAGFYLFLVSGAVWMFFIFKNWKKIGKVKNYKLKPSLSFLKKIPSLVIIKTMDLAMFSVFLFFFTRYALQTLGLSRSMVSIIVVAETIAFMLSSVLVGRISNKGRRKYWIPVCVILQLLAGIAMITATSLPSYFLVAILIGVAGGFVEVWIFSKISETVKQYDKGAFYGTFGWSYDLETIVGAQLPVLLIMSNLNQFYSFFVIPAIMIIGYLLSIKKRNVKA
ncbi:MAG: MFS transporter [Candidatus Aenigmatarchaeota archaeon]